MVDMPNYFQYVSVALPILSVCTAIGAIWYEQRSYTRSSDILFDDLLKITEKKKEDFSCLEAVLHDTKITPEIKNDLRNAFIDHFERLGAVKIVHVE